MYRFLLALLSLSAQARIGDTTLGTNELGVHHVLLGEIIGTTPKPGPATRPDLSTLATAITANGHGEDGLADNLEISTPQTVFAPSNEAFAKLPAAVLANLLKKKNFAQLLDILTYHMVWGVRALAKDLHDGQMIPTIQGKNVTVRVTGGDVFVNSAKVTTADVGAVNGVVHIIDAVLMPPQGNALFFRGFDQFRDATSTEPAYDNINCGDVDAAPRMPASLFEPANSDALRAYTNITLALYNVGGGALEGHKLELGRCAELGYIEPYYRYPQAQANWAPVGLMKEICREKCACAFPGSSIPGLPKCADIPDDPAAKQWCSLCGPTFNKPILVNIFSCSGTYNCREPDTNTASTPWEDVVKDLLELL